MPRLRRIVEPALSLLLRSMQHSLSSTSLLRGLLPLSSSLAALQNEDPPGNRWCRWTVLRRSIERPNMREQTDQEIHTRILAKSAEIVVAGPRDELGPTPYRQQHIRPPGYAVLTAPTGS